MPRAPVPGPPARPPLVRSVLRWLACAALTVALLPPVPLLALVSRERAARQFRRWAERNLSVFDVRVRVVDENSGRWPSPPHVYVHLNQTTLLETFLYPVAFRGPAIILMNVEYALIPVVGWTLWLLGGVVIVRQWPAQAKRGVARAARKVRAGRSLGLSIEGRRSPDGTPQPFKKGPVVLAIEAQAPIVPFVTRGARERLPFGEWRVRPGEVEVVLCEAIPTRGLTLAERDLVLERLRRVAEEKLGTAG